MSAIKYNNRARSGVEAIRIMYDHMTSEYIEKTLAAKFAETEEESNMHAARAVKLKARIALYDKYMSKELLETDPMTVIMKKKELAHV